jgi:hypothetical protein
MTRSSNSFPILSRTKYLVSHSLGAMPEATRDALVEGEILRTDRWKRQAEKRTIAT